MAKIISLDTSNAEIRYRLLLKKLCNSNIARMEMIRDYAGLYSYEDWRTDINKMSKDLERMLICLQRITTADKPRDGGKGA
jgi:hypothetical protein